MKQLWLFAVSAAFVTGSGVNCLAQSAPGDLRKSAKQAIETASDFYSKIALNGGYVYYYSMNQKRRYGEGVASDTQIWVQPPGTPTVGEAFLDAFEATGQPRFLVYATKAGIALCHGQLKSGGWTNSIDFDPNSSHAGLYRNGQGKGKNNSSLDDDQTGSALRFLIRLDVALNHENDLINESTEFGLNALLNAQFANGGFPQVWKQPVDSNRPIKLASYPAYDWKTENRIKNYWDLYTLNDDVAGSVARALILAHQAYDNPKFLKRLESLGDFLVAAQMPQPQPAWAQQYDYEMRPVWARRFEPPAIATDETQEVITILLLISLYTDSQKYLKPIPSALEWLSRSSLNSRELARFYELRTNRPLYMNRRGKDYNLTYSDAGLPSHYSWKIRNRTEKLKKLYDLVAGGKLNFDELNQELFRPKQPSKKETQGLIDSLDSQGRWVDVYKGDRLAGQPKFNGNEKYLSSQTFSDNISSLRAFIISR